MANKNDASKDELADVGKGAPEQSKRNTRKDAVQERNASDTAETRKSTRTSSAPTSRGGKPIKGDDELDDVETIPKEQAIAEMRAAIEKARKAAKK